METEYAPQTVETPLYCVEMLREAYPELIERFNNRFAHQPRNTSY